MNLKPITTFAALHEAQTQGLTIYVRSSPHKETRPSTGAPVTPKHFKNALLAGWRYFCEDEAEVP